MNDQEREALVKWADSVNAAIVANNKKTGEAIRDWAESFERRICARNVAFGIPTAPDAPTYSGAWGHVSPPEAREEDERRRRAFDCIETKGAPRRAPYFGGSVAPSSGSYATRAERIVRKVAEGYALSQQGAARQLVKEMDA